jgi:hypothetical protein
MMIIVVVMRRDGCSGGCTDPSSNNRPVASADLGANDATEYATNASSDRGILHRIVVVVSPARYGEHAPQD